MKDGVISGRWATRRMLGALSGVKDPLKPGGYLCGDSGTYAQIKRLICDARDVVAAVQNDNTNAYCDSLSIALGFAALPARMGTPWSGGPLPAPCGPQWDDDCSK